ncbi:MAG: hypothetical protein J0G99_11635 [Alphaproteobacteria bacterium]|nr:hypothetical protein [Alphaproteobacteria bacterium]
MRFTRTVLLVSCVVVGASSLTGLGALAQDQDRDRIQDRVQDQVPDQDRTRDQLRDRDQVPDQDRTRDRLRDQTSVPSSSATATGGAGQVQYGPRNVYGWQLMTAQERATYQNQMHNATTAQERDRIQAQHRSEMQQRARQRNVVLPGMSGARGGMGMGGMGGMGPGMGGMGSPPDAGRRGR